MLVAAIGPLLRSLTHRRFVAGLVAFGMLLALNAQAFARHIKVHLYGDSITSASPGGSQGPVGGFRQPLVTSLIAAAVDMELVGNRNSADITGAMTGASLHDGWAGYKVEDIQATITPSALGGGGGAFRNEDLASVLAGTNNILGGDTSLTSSMNGAINLLGLMRTIWQGNNFATSFLLVKIPPTANDSVMTPLYGYSGCNIRATAFNAAIATVADRARQEGMDVTVVDAGLLQADISTDGVHPQSSGWTKLANALSAAIQVFAARTLPIRPSTAMVIPPEMSPRFLLDVLDRRRRGHADNDDSYLLERDEKVA